MPSIFFLSLMNGSPWGGSEELWYQTSLYAAGEGYRVGCAYYDWEEKTEKTEKLKTAGCTVYLLTNKGRRKRNWKEKLQYKWSKRTARLEAEKLPFSDYELVVVNLGGLEIYTAAWKSFYRRLGKYVLLFHNYSETDRFETRQVLRLREWINGAAANLFAARRIRTLLEERLSMPLPHAQLFINPITITPPTSVTPYPQLNGTTLFVVLAELDVSRKAQDNLLSAFSLPQWKTRDWQLYLYGNGNDRQRLSDQINSLQLQSKVHLKGHTRDVAVALSQAHLVLQITHMDAMPLAVVEAMAMARPLVVSRVGDMPYWVIENQNGWLAENASVTKTEEALERAWQQRENWPQAGEASFRLFGQKFPANPPEQFLAQLPLSSPKL